jgi:hypothetical protein
LSSNEQVKLKHLEKAITVVSLPSHLTSISPEDKKQILSSLAALYLSIAIEDEDNLEEDDVVKKRGNFRRCIDTFTASEARINFRFEKKQLRVLLPLLKFPAECRLSNGSKMRGEEIFLRGLYELVTGMNQELIAANIFGREQSSQCRAFSYFINHIYSHFHHLVHDNLDWYFRNGLAEASAAAIGAKIGIPDNLVSVFIDCNCLPTSVCGGGPAEDGANAARWDEAISRAFYNGWKSINGLKHQTINDAFGFCPDMCGPGSLRRNDLTMLRRSNLNERFRLAQRLRQLQLIIMGDSAYRKQSHITSYHKGVDLIDGAKAWNSKFKKVRISIEWDYGQTASLFKYLTRREKLRLMASNDVSKVYTVCTILRNIHLGYNGCQTSNYFNVTLPDNFVEKYLTQTDFHDTV